MIVVYTENFDELGHIKLDETGDTTYPAAKRKVQVLIKTRMQQQSYGRMTMAIGQLSNVPATSVAKSTKILLP